MSRSKDSGNGPAADRFAPRFDHKIVLLMRACADRPALLDIWECMLEVRLHKDFLLAWNTHKPKGNLPEIIKEPISCHRCGAYQTRCRTIGSSVGAWICLCRLNPMTPKEDSQILFEWMVCNVALLDEWVVAPFKHGKGWSVTVCVPQKDRHYYIRKRKVS